MKRCVFVFIFSFCICTFLLVGSDFVFAQDEAVVVDTGVEANENNDTSSAASASARVESTEKQVDKVAPKKKILSLFFTYWQSRAIDDAVNSQGQGMVRPPTPDELQGDVEPEPGERNIRLGGIAFTTDDDWTIWLNGQRVTPNAIPKEVLDLRVYREYIEIKWIDEYTNQIFPLRLRAHQRFNLDARIFLPG